jgi:hypothetical protein
MNSASLGHLDKVQSQVGVPEVARYRHKSRENGGSAQSDPKSGGGEHQGEGSEGVVGFWASNHAP